MKKILAIALILALSASMAACSGGAKPAPSAAESSAPAEATTESSKANTELAADASSHIVFWARINDLELLEDSIANFQEQNPNVTVEATAVGTDYDGIVQRLMTGIAAADTPQVLMLGQRFGIPQVYDSGVLIPIEDFMTDDELNDILPAFWERFTYKGKRLAMPFQCSIPVIFYNVDMFKEKGLTPPTTMDELMEVAKALSVDTNGDGVNDIYGFNTPSGSSWYTACMVKGQNANIVQPDGGMILNSPEVVRTFEYFKKMVHEDQSLPANQAGTAQDDFANGLLGMHMGSCASRGSITKKVGDKFEYDIAMFPKLDTVATSVGGNSLGIIKSTPDQEAASWLFVQYLVDIDTFVDVTLKKGYIPIRNSAMQDEKVMEILKQPSSLVVTEQMQYLACDPVSPADSVMWAGLDDVMGLVQSDPNVDIQAELDTVQARLDKFLADYQK